MYSTTKSCIKKMGKYYNNKNSFILEWVSTTITIIITYLAECQKIKSRKSTKVYAHLITILEIERLFLIDF